MKTGSLYLRGCTLIDGTGAAAHSVPMTVHMENGRFKSIRPDSESPPAPAGVAVIDAKGKYVIPGAGSATRVRTR